MKFVLPASLVRLVSELTLNFIEYFKKDPVNRKFMEMPNELFSIAI